MGSGVSLTLWPPQTCEFVASELLVDAIVTFVK